MNGNRRKGFSLFEMLLVVAMIGLISTAAVPVAELMFIKSKENELEANLAQIRQAISLWKRDCRNAVVKQYEYRGLLSIPDANLYPPSLIALMRPDTLPDGGIHGVKNYSGVVIASFSARPYLNSIPIDPFVGAATWKVHYASGTTPVIFEGGAIVGPIPADHVGIFDVSPVENDAPPGNRRRGFVQAIDGTNYEDW